MSIRKCNVLVSSFDGDMPLAPGDHSHLLCTAQFTRWLVFGYTHYRVKSDGTASPPTVHAMSLDTPGLNLHMRPDWSKWKSVSRHLYSQQFTQSVLVCHSGAERQRYAVSNVCLVAWCQDCYREDEGGRGFPLTVASYIHWLKSALCQHGRAMDRSAHF